MRLLIDTKQFQIKPVGNKTISGINKRLEVADLTPKELAGFAVHGCSFTCGYFEGGRSNENWRSQQYFGLDFDGGITIDEFVKACERYEILPVFVYTTFSHTDVHHKFRAIFALNVEITDRRVRFLVHNALTRLFDGKADNQCRDAARLFFGGIDIVYDNFSYRVDIVELVQALCSKYEVENKSNAARNIRTFCEECYVNMNDTFPAVKYMPVGTLHDFEENAGNSIRYTVELPVKSSTLCISFACNEDNFSPVTHKARGGYKLNKANNITRFKSRWTSREKLDLNEIPQQCQLAREFENGSRYLPYNERYHLASNYIQLKGGEKRFMKAMNLREEYNHEFRKERAKAAINYAKANNYMPTSCSISNCPFFHTCPGKCANILLKLEQKRGEVRRIDPIVPGKSLIQAEAELQQVLSNAYNNPTTSITVIKASTGLGKTEVVTKLQLMDVIFAVPTHKLRDEVYHRLNQNGHDFLNVFDRPEFIDKPDEDLYQSYIKVGANKKAVRMLFKIADKYRSMISKTTDANIAAKMAAVIDYSNMIKQIPHASNLLVTHKRLVNMDTTNAKTIIIDEDILMNELLPLSQVSLNDLGILFGRAMAFDQDLFLSLQAMNMQVMQTPVNQIQELKDVLVKSEDLEDFLAANAKDLSTNIMELFTCDYFVRTKDNMIHCVKKIDLAQLFPGKRIIIMSASANEKMYRQAFGNINFIDLGKVTMTGSVVGHFKKGYSRHSLKDAARFHKEMAVIKLDIGNTNVITYKGYKTEMLHEGLNVVATFGATAGLDQFKGQDLAIIGTPHVNNIKYVMMAKALGVKVTMDDQNGCEYVPVRRNGYEFYFNTYSKNPMLQEIQFAVIESELIQAIGRARALRYPCKVHVYSNLPLDF